MREVDIMLDSPATFRKGIYPELQYSDSPFQKLVDCEGLNTQSHFLSKKSKETAISGEIEILGDYLPTKQGVRLYPKDCNDTNFENMT